MARDELYLTRFNQEHIGSRLMTLDCKHNSSVTSKEKYEHKWPSLFLEIEKAVITVTALCSQLGAVAPSTETPGTHLPGADGPHILNFFQKPKD